VRIVKLTVAVHLLQAGSPHSCEPADRQEGGETARLMGRRATLNKHESSPVGIFTAVCVLVGSNARTLEATCRPQPQEQHFLLENPNQEIMLLQARALLSIFGQSEEAPGGTCCSLVEKDQQQLMRIHVSKLPFSIPTRLRIATPD
jgi:hypothetical protein